MKILRLTAATIALVGFAAAQAQESAGEVTAETENQQEFRWSDYPIEESTLTAQAKTAYAILRVRDAAEYGTPLEIDTVAVDLADASDRTPNSGLCRDRMPRPGSRIVVKDRCIYESPGEAALNEFQYEMERRRMQELADIRFLDYAEYNMAYRREQARQQ